MNESPIPEGNLDRPAPRWKRSILAPWGAPEWKDTPQEMRRGWRDFAIFVIGLSAIAAIIACSVPG